jgi:hypothetical protein
LFDANARALACACSACAILFSGGAQTRYTRLRAAAERLAEVELGRADLEALGVPVTLVCFCPSVLHGRVFAMYPNAAGAIETEVAMQDWLALVASQPALAAVKADRDALLVDARGACAQCFCLSMDVCQRLLGLLRGRPGRAGFAAFEAALLALSGGTYA